MPTIRFFKTPQHFRRWLSLYHASKAEVVVGFYKKDSGLQSISWPESVDQALCFGWIDGIRKRIDQKSYSIRFTPRKASSTWSQVNIRRAKELITLGLMRPSGLSAFRLRDEKKTRLYSYERRQRGLDAKLLRMLAGKKKAWTYFSAQAPWYQKTAGFWVMSAKKEETRLKRFGSLVQCCEEGIKIQPFRALEKKNP